ncbi:MAG: glycosyltransferase [Caldilineae bacterium]|nr:MAG: glycosyltransferase [Caldilineae bacterium]
MHILFVAPFGLCQKQTVPRRLLPLAQSLSHHGYRLTLLVPAWDCPQQAGRDEWIGAVRIISPRLGPAPHPYLDLRLLLGLLRTVRLLAPDLLFVSKGLGYAWFVARLGARFVLDIDDLEDMAGWGRIRPWPWNRLAQAQERHLRGRAAGITVAARDLLPAPGHTATPHLYLPNGLFPAPSPAEVQRNPPVAVLYTRGVDVSAARLARLWRRILSLAPEARLHIIGDWTAAPELPRSRRLGWLQEPDLTAALRGAALALFPVEDTPLIRAKSPARLLDCLGHGLPVLALPVGEYRHLLGDGSPMLVADDEDMARTAARLLSDPEARRPYARAAWQCALRHTWIRRAEELHRWLVDLP